MSITWPTPRFRVSTSVVFAGHCDRFRHLTEPQHDSTTGFAIDLQHDAGLLKRPEPLQLHFQSIGSDRKIRQYVRTTCFRHGASRHAGVGLCRGDVSSRQHTTA